MRRTCATPAMLVAILAVAAAGCGAASSEPAADARTALRLPPGSVPRGTSELHARVRAPGPPVTPALLADGERGYRGKCAACHGTALAGDGPVVRLGYPPPPPIEPGQHAAEHVVDVIARGHGDMPAMAGQVPPLERWAIARWIERR